MLKYKVRTGLFAVATAFSSPMFFCILLDSDLFHRSDCGSFVLPPAPAAYVSSYLNNIDTATLVATFVRLLRAIAHRF